jgi:GT2 family glycosyltransferase
VLMNDAPFISIIIPALNSPNLSDTLLALMRQTASSQIKEIIIVGQQDENTLPYVPKSINIYVADFPSAAHNRNVGAQVASGNWLLFTDSDCMPKPNWVEEIIAAISSTNKVLAGAVDIPAGMTYWGICDHYFGFEKMAVGIANQRTLPYAATLNFAIERSLFSEIGGFNETFSDAGGEDREFCWRITLKGERIHFTPKAIVLHNHPRGNLSSAWTHCFHYGIVAGKFRLMHLKSNSIIRQLGLQIVKIPVMGELVGLVRIIFRAIIRFVSKAYQKKVIYLPGIMFLDLAFTIGMIRTLRKNG